MKMAIKFCIASVLVVQSLLVISLALQSQDVEVNVSDPTEGSSDDLAIFFTSNEMEMNDVPVYFTKALPSWLKGTLVRNGPGKFENGDRTFLHVFDGFAKLASWHFHGNGSVVFSTRFITSSFYKDSIASDTIAPYLLIMAVSPTFNTLDKMRCMSNGIDNMNVNFYMFRNPKTLKPQYAALTDAWPLYEISLRTLSTKRLVSPDVKIRETADQLQTSPNSIRYVSTVSSAHPLPEYGTSNFLTFVCSTAIFPWWSYKMSLIRINSLTRRQVVAQWSIDGTPYMHSFSVTQTKAILLVSPLYVDYTCFFMKIELFSCFKFYPEQQSTFYVIDLKTGAVDSITTSNVFAMHHINAFDVPDSNNIVMDLASYDSPDFLQSMQLHIIRDPVKRNEMPVESRLKRVTIDISRKSIVVVDIDLRPKPSIASYLEVPAINEARRSLHYCYIYGVVFKADNVTFAKMALVKKDICNNGTGDQFWMVPGQYPLEPWFVARPDAVDEDDGILMVPVLRGFKRSTYLIMLDAKDLRPITEAKTPTNIPFSNHGRFFPSSPSLKPAL